jgi:type II secretory pathway pseudopilin PulG
LIEVMIVIGIVGILASIAIPSFLGFQRRAKLSEVKIIVPAVFRDITQTFVQTSRWPWGTGPGATPWNPPLPPGGVYTKEKWVTNDPVWSQVTFSTEQPVWCRYMAHSGSPDYVIYIDVQCDLDADGDVCHYSEGFNTRTNQMLNCKGATPEAECAGHIPASGEISGDNDCTL